MKNSLETRLGAFFALVVIASFILFELIGAGSLFHRGTPLRARFESVRDLKVGDPVKLAGVQVGRVTGIKLAEGKVEVVLQVESDAPVASDSVASIQFTGLLGQNFVALSFGNPQSPRATADTLLQSREQPDLATILAKLEGVADGVQGMARSFSGDELSKLLGPVTDFVKQSQPRIMAILGNVQSITAGVAAGKGAVGRLINDDTLYTSALSTVSNLNSTVGEIRPLAQDARATVAEARKAVEGINRGEGTVGRLLKEDKLYGETTSAVTNLKEILQKINQGKGTVGGLVNDDSFLKNIKLTLQKVDKATEGLEDTGPLTIVGAVAGKLF